MGTKIVWCKHCHNVIRHSTDINIVGSVAEFETCSTCEKKGMDWKPKEGEKKKDNEQ